MTDALDAVGMTAIGVARVRARESAKPDGLIDDPLASVFVPDWDTPRNLEGLTKDDRRAMVRMYSWIVARTIYLDRLCVSASGAGIEQFVILGVGLDARPFRLKSSSRPTRWFELDRPQVIEYRARAIERSGIKPVHQRVPVIADLADDWPSTLHASGFDSRLPTMWLAEGLLVYLAATVVESLLTRLSGLSAPGSRLGATIRGGGAQVQGGSDVFADVEALWHHTGDVDGRLRELRWSTRLTSATDVLIAAGRLPASTPTSTPTLLSGRL